ncbi:hypothetical protein NUW54_g2573 [Trametes sanguinea]|uniref:Uncharacterized protein n=1 Tax=Trametes sanguinea TaxID=158606 RepID=A0ACC1Q532_9APHY|nr:hypothetical protein NUW54_g2573 [Trametes sanguinea]
MSASERHTFKQWAWARQAKADDGAGPELVISHAQLRPLQSRSPGIFRCHCRTMTVSPLHISTDGTHPSVPASMVNLETTGADLEDQHGIAQKSQGAIDDRCNLNCDATREHGR